MSDELKLLRSAVLKEYGANDFIAEELISYNTNLFISSSQNDKDLRKNSVLDLSFPLQDEPHIQVWSEYISDVRSNGFAALKKYLVQLQFPIQSGISETEEYRLATRKGISLKNNSADDGIVLHRPDLFRIFIHPTLAGSIPVMVTGYRADFEALIQALIKRNEPMSIPDSMGACIIGGYNNWDRVHRYRSQWERQHPTCCSEEDWLNEFKSLIPQTSLYKDRFIILSDGPYSNVQGKCIDLSDDIWKLHSLTIRLEHECTHYFTRRVFNSMRNNLLDELIADYMGIVGAIGYYRADWFLRFVGLEAYPNYREDGRLSAYKGDPPLSHKAFVVLQGLVKAASENVEKFDRKYHTSKRGKSDQIATLIALTNLTLEELASDKAITLITDAVKEARSKIKILV